MATTNFDPGSFDPAAAVSAALTFSSEAIDTMVQLVENASTFTSAAEGGIVLVDDAGVLHVVASTSERMKEVEESQLGALEGPCLECYSSGDPVDVADIEAVADRWPAFAEAARERGLRAAHAVPLRSGGIVLGALCLLSTTTGPLSDRDAALAQAMADAATRSMVRVDNHAQVASQLQKALESRILIEQAKGALASRLEISVDEAFRHLRTQSQTSRMSLRLVAENVIRQLTTDGVG